MPTILALIDIFGFFKEHAVEGKVEIDVWTRPKQHMLVTWGGRGCTRIADGEYSESHLRLLTATPLGPRWVLLVILDFRFKFLLVIECHVASILFSQQLGTFWRCNINASHTDWPNFRHQKVDTCHAHCRPQLTPGNQFGYTNSSVNRYPHLKKKKKSVWLIDSTSTIKVPSKS